MSGGSDRTVPGTSSVFAERVMGGNYIEFNIDRDAIARYGLALGDVQDVLEVALGGMPLTTTVPQTASRIARGHWPVIARYSVPSGVSPASGGVVISGGGLSGIGVGDRSGVDEFREHCRR